MTSRPAATSNTSSFKSKTKFDALLVDDIESEEEDEFQHVEPDPEPALAPSPPIPVEAPSAPIETARSRSAQKRAAKKAAAAVITATNSTPEPTLTVVVPPPSESPAEVASPTLNEVSDGPSSAQVAAPPSPSNSTLKPSVSSIRGRSPSRQSDTVPFSPTLPEPFPQLPPADIVRKRKASHDLTSNPLSKESKVDPKVSGSPTAVKSQNGYTTATTDSGEKVGVVKLAVVPSSATHGADHEKGKRMQQALTRTIWTLIMIGGFVALLMAGPPYMILLVFVAQAMVYREVTALFGLTHKSVDHQHVEGDEMKDPWSKTLNWYFFGITNYFLYGESIIYYFKHIIFADVRFLPFANNHRFISFMLYILGFVGYVMSLKKQFLRQQFGLFGWVHMSLLVIVVSSHFIVNNILEGMIWFWVPASLVICNDVFAYIWGMTFGKTPLIKLSPKKTVEGFVGAFFSTLIFGFLWATFFIRFNYMICPATDLGMSVWSDVQCRPNPVFVWRLYELPGPVQQFLSGVIGMHIPPIPWAPFQYHALIMATFASLVAPFGGFFASGFKRAFDIKDFGHSIPGHGGMTDRMDCQFLMGMFSYVYYSSLIRVHRVTVGSVLQTVVTHLSTGEQLQLLSDLRRYLEGSGVL